LANPPFERFTGIGFKTCIRAQSLFGKRRSISKIPNAFLSAEGIDRLDPGPIKGFEAASRMI
jgi:hypothetical protein